MNRDMLVGMEEKPSVPHASGDEPERSHKIVKSCNPTLKKSGWRFTCVSNPGSRLLDSRESPFVSLCFYSFIPPTCVECLNT